MNSTILRISSQYLMVILITLSLLLLYRGHNLPGGGFIGGLVAASAVILKALAVGWGEMDNRLIFSPINFIIGGLFVATISAFPALLVGEPLMTGLWFPPIDAGFLGKIKLGTPFLFDVGVYLTVIGFTLKCAIEFGATNESWKS